MEQNNMQKVKETVMVGEGYLHIKRLPKNTVREIIDFFNNEQEFAGDWAMAMKHVWDTYKGMLAPKDQQIINEIQLLHQRIDAIEHKINSVHIAKEQSKGVRLANGTTKSRSEE